MKHLMLIFFLTATTTTAFSQKPGLHFSKGKKIKIAWNQARFNLTGLAAFPSKILPEQPSFVKYEPFSIRAQSCFPAYNSHDLAFFCRLEVRLERAVRYPVKFRLGEVQYTEGLEGKGGWLPVKQ
jgi:hypothetical protein